MSIETALAYHERTKHWPGRYARSLGYLDWATQPDPFRRFDGAPRVSLDRPPVTEAPSLDAFPPAAPIDRASISQLLFDSFAISAWKESGRSRWSLRCNPSSGNLHPTEAYVITDAIGGPAIHHYQPFLHALERRRSIERVPSATFFVALTSIHWREAWKYGERAYRYCQHDVGHAIGALGYAAAALGWRTRVLWSANDDDLERLLGAQSGVEAEHPDVLIGVSARGELPDPIDLGTLGELAGAPNVLSEDHQPWPIIDDVARACRRVDRPSTIALPTVDPLPDRGISARRMFRQRRSAVDMDGVTAISAEVFHRMVRQLDARFSPARSLASAPRVHAAFFVHRVTGVAPGLYLLARRDGALDEMRAAMHPDFEWERATDDLVLLAPGDARGPARLVMCDQQIAADGAFAVAFLAELDLSAAWQYRLVHWEAGLLGQVLYLEAEAAGVRATGIGCFFDDLVHELLGLEDRRFQMIYGFTVGGPVDDPRLRTIESYAHLEET